MKLKNIGFAGMVLAVAAVSPAVMADDTIVLTQGPYSYYVGGEFTSLTGTPIDANYAASTKETINGQTYFQTFCVQTEVDFYPGVTYNYTMSLASVDNPDNRDVFPLSQGTAWLYSQFAQGILANYNYTDTATPTRNADADALQAAIWYLQGDQSYGNYVFGGSGNIFYDEAVTLLGANVNSNATYSFDYGVEVLNLTSTGGNSAQNQLVYLGSGGGSGNQDPVPDDGATLALLALSLAGLAVFARGSGAAQRAA